MLLGIDEGHKQLAEYQEVVAEDVLYELVFVVEFDVSFL